MSENYKIQPLGSRCGWLKNGNPPCDLQALPRCQATAKSTGRRCGLPAMRGKTVCYIHGGRSPGAPKNNRNAWKDGAYSAKSREEIREARAFLHECAVLLSELG